MTFGLSKAEVVAVMARKSSSVALDVMRFLSERPEGATCDEFIVARSMDRGLVTPRFTELRQAGCIRLNGRKRSTRYGGHAAVYEVVPGSDFHDYLRAAGSRSRKRAVPTGSPEDAEYAAAARSFVRSWKKARTKAGKAGALDALVRSVLKVAGARA